MSLWPQRTCLLTKDSFQDLPSLNIHFFLTILHENLSQGLHRLEKEKMQHAPNKVKTFVY